MASALRPVQSLQTHLFHSPDQLLKNKKLMASIDQVNQKMGRNTVFFASCGTHNTWSRKEQWRSPRYTTQWGEILEV
jgi:DNA polymerase V